MIIFPVPQNSLCAVYTDALWDVKQTFLPSVDHGVLVNSSHGSELFPSSSLPKHSLHTERSKHFLLHHTAVVRKNSTYLFQTISPQFRMCLKQMCLKTWHKKKRNDICFTFKLQIFTHWLVSNRFNCATNLYMSKIYVYRTTFHTQKLLLWSRHPQWLQARTNFTHKEAQLGQSLSCPIHSHWESWEGCSGTMDCLTVVLSGSEVWHIKSESKFHANL